MRKSRSWPWTNSCAMAEVIESTSSCLRASVAISCASCSPADAVVSPTCMSATGFGASSRKVV